MTDEPAHDDTMAGLFALAHDLGLGPEMAVAQAELKIALQATEIIRLRAALQRLADCNWTITPMDRMDAVRDIARAALAGSNERPHP